MKKCLLFTSLAFLAGFLTHALFFPDFLSNGITDVSQIVLPNPTPSGATKLRNLTTTITYDGEHFNHHNVTIEVGTYLAIKNASSEKLMWLYSNDPNLSTPRGYAQSEIVQKRMDSKGTTIIEDKNNPSEKLIIMVK